MTNLVARNVKSAVEVISEIVSFAKQDNKLDPQSLATLTAGILIAAQLENLANAISAIKD